MNRPFRRKAPAPARAPMFVTPYPQPMQVPQPWVAPPPGMFAPAPQYASMPVQRWTAPGPEPTWLEAEVGARMPSPQGGQLGRPVWLSKNVALRSRAGWTAIVQEIAPGQWLVSEAPSAAVSGIGVVPVVTAAAAALSSLVKSITQAVQKAKAKKEAEAAAPASNLPGEVGCRGRCTCQTHGGGW